MTIEWLQRMKLAGLDPTWAEAIASMPEERLVTPDYLDARLKAELADLKNELTWRMLGTAGLIIVLIGLLDKFVRP